jgi:hypothetical protein
MFSRLLTSIHEIDTSKNMPEEVIRDQSEHRQNQPQHFEQSKGASTELTMYIDNTLLKPLRERAGSRALASNPAGRLEVNEDERISQEISRFEQMRQEVTQGNFSSIATELQARRAEPETRLAALRPRLRPRGEMNREDEYFALKEEILTGDRIREKVKGVLDDTELAWVVKSNEYRKDKQSETERGRLMRDINKEQQTLDEITHLQQLISQPPQQ